MPSTFAVAMGRNLRPRHTAMSVLLQALTCTLLLGFCEAQSRLLATVVTVPPVRKCPPGKVFDDCGWACPLTCDNLYRPIFCPYKCISGCFCPEGLVEFGESCIDPIECPGATTEPTTDPYQPTTDQTTDTYQPTTDPYRPFEPYDPYPYYYCDLNEDEYGRPYYGPNDEYYRPGQSYPPTAEPTPQPPTYVTPPYIAATGFPAPRNTRQATSLPTCFTSNECKAKPIYCKGTGTRYDHCGRRCTCTGGQLINCCRVRKEWRSMTQADRCRYVGVVYEASTKEPWKSCYDELIKVHRDEFGSGIHGQTFFLPWHRWYLLALENLLRRIDCNVTIPYWDWSLEPQTWQNSILWAAQCGLGGDGNPADNDHVTTGEFRRSNWMLTPSAGGWLQRQFNGDVPDCASVAMIQRSGVAEFDTWHTFISSNLHDAVHCIIGGTMCTQESANAPEFLLHHGFIDKLWADWQNKGPAFRNLPYYAQNTNAMPGAFGYSPSTLYSLDSQPGCVRVCIEPPARPCRINTTSTPVCAREISCREYSPIKLAGLIPRPYPTVPKEAHALFNTPQAVRKMSIRFSELFTNVDELYSLLQKNGYISGSPVKYRPTQGELQFDRYILQPPSPSYYATNSSTQIPLECRPYLSN